MINLGYQYVDPQAQMQVETRPVQLPQYNDFGTNHAFMNKGDGDGQSTKDRVQFQQLAVKQSKKAKKAHGPWKPLAADKLFHFKGVHFKGFNKKKAAMLHKMKQQAQLQMKHSEAQQPKQLWPSSVIAGSGPQANTYKSARPVFNSDMPTGPMGTNGVFLGSHQGGDSTFSSHGAPQGYVPHAAPPRASAAPRAAPADHMNANAPAGRANGGNAQPVVSPYMSVTHKAMPHMLAMQQQRPLWPTSVVGQQPANGPADQMNSNAPAGGAFPASPYMSVTHKAMPHMLAMQRQKQLWPSSVIGQQPAQGHDTRNHPWISAADGSVVPMSARRLPLQRLAFANGGMQNKGMSFAPKVDEYGRRQQWTMAADGSLMGAAGCVGTTCH